MEHAQSKPKTLQSFEISNEKEDRISLLPDCLIIEILSRLPDTKYAIRTGTLSKRWLHLWTSVPTLIFRNSKGSCSDFFSFVDKTINQCSHQFKINKFAVYTSYDSRFESQVNDWIRFAINRNLQNVNLTLLSGYSRYELHQLIFNTSSITSLTLSRCLFIPTGAISWDNLKTLNISRAKLDEDLIQNVLSGSPLLETLKLDSCWGFRRLDITSKSVKNLVLSGHVCVDMCINMRENIMLINTPNILSLTIKGELWLYKLLLVDASSVVKAYFNYLTIGHYETTLKEAQEEMLKSCILKLPHAKTLILGKLCSRVFSRLEGKGITSQLKIKNIDHGSNKDEVDRLMAS